MNANQKKVVIVCLVVAALITGCATTRGDPGHYYALMVNDEGKEVECEAIGFGVINGNNAYNTLARKGTDLFSLSRRMDGTPRGIRTPDTQVRISDSPGSATGNV